MSASFFLDTNILIYSFDNNQPRKKERALALIGEALQNRQGMISTQVVQEFLNVVTRRFAVPLSLEDCQVYLKMVLGPLCKVYPDMALYETSLDIQHKVGYSFYDALILAGAVHGGCEVLYSEDLQDEQLVETVRIINPFRDIEEAE